MATKAEQAERTRAALISAGRGLFGAQGFAGTSTEQIVTTAGVTRGALYHHFVDKRALFEAVYEDVERTMVAHVMRRVATGSQEPLDVLSRGAEAFLDACLDPESQRISLIEGPSVLGWRRWREIDQAYGFGMVLHALQAAMDAGALRPAPVEPLAHIVFGGLVEAALLLASSPSPKRARKDAGKAVQAILSGLSA